MTDQSLTANASQPEKFINREEELQSLEELYEKTKDTAQFLVLYGKRRVGKTELIKHAFSTKPFLYYLATKGTTKDQLRTLTRLIVSYFYEEYLSQDAFPTFRELFDYLGKKLKESGERLVLVIDEFPYLAQSDEAASSYFQYGWDEQLKNTHALFVLMGSSIAMMHRHVLSPKAPLYDRRTSSWQLEPFSFAQARKFYPKADFERAFSFFAILGGVPAYLREFSEEKSLLQNIEEKILKKREFLNVEPDYLIFEEFKEPNKYLTILKGIGVGRTHYGELLLATGLKNNELSSYLRTLIDLRLVKRELPITEKNPHNSKKGTYSLADNFLRFYFSLIYPNQSLIESGSSSALFERNKGVLINLLAKAYEDASTEFVKEGIKKGALPSFEQFGRWWNKDTEIDLLGLNGHDNAILAVETKWNTQPIGTEILRELKKKASLVPWGRLGRKEYFALIAKGGFSDRLVEQAKKDKIVLIYRDQIV